MARSRNVAAVELCNYETRQEALRRKVAEFSTMAGSNAFVQQAEGVVEAETQCEEQTQMEPETPVFQQHSASTDGEAERITRVFHGLLFSSSLASAVRTREEHYMANEDRTVKENRQAQKFSSLVEHGRAPRVTARAAGLVNAAAGGDQRKQPDLTDHAVLGKILAQSKIFLVSLVGTGGHGEVHSAEINGRQVALKVNRVADLLSKVLLQRELRMLEYATGLAHVVQLGALQTGQFGAVTLSEQCIAVPLKWVEHVPFGEAAADPQWRTGGAVACIHVLVQAMKGLHSRKLVHGDLKIENVMIDRSLKSVTVGDLGLTRLESIGFNGYGTAGFRAPETDGHMDLVHMDPMNAVRPRMTGAAAFALDMWACGVTALLFAAGKRYVCPKRYAVSVEHDAESRSRRQDQELSSRAMSAQSTMWVREVAFSRNARAMVAEPPIWQAISGMLNFKSRSRLSAVRALVYFP
jgi:hypothetical protein